MGHPANDQNSRHQSSAKSKKCSVSKGALPLKRGLHEVTVGGVCEAANLAPTTVAEVGPLVKSKNPAPDSHTQSNQDEHQYKSVGNGAVSPCVEQLPWGMVDPGWTGPQRKLVLSMLSRVGYAFQLHEKDHSFVKGHEVSIDTGNARPVVMPQYRQEQTKLIPGRVLVQDFLDMTILEPSSSAWRSPLLFVTKPDGSIRMTIDLRGVNSVTKKDQFPLPRIDDMLERMKGAKFMTKLDLKNAFFQILLKAEDREKTAFAFDGALYQFRALPQGLVHSPANLCRIMHSILAPYQAFSLPYMDDVAVVGSTFEELISNCEVVFAALERLG